MSKPLHQGPPVDLTFCVDTTGHPSWRPVQAIVEKFQHRGLKFEPVDNDRVLLIAFEPTLYGNWGNEVREELAKLGMPFGETRNHTVRRDIGKRVLADFSAGSPRGKMWQGFNPQKFRES